MLSPSRVKKKNRKSKKHSREWSWAGSLGYQGNPMQKGNVFVDMYDMHQAETERK